MFFFFQTRALFWAKNAFFAKNWFFDFFWEKSNSIHFFVYLLSLFKKKTRSLAFSVAYLCYFEIRHLQIQDGRQLNMQISKVLHFSLFLDPSVLDTKYEVSSMFNKRKSVFGAYLPLSISWRFDSSYVY